MPLCFRLPVLLFAWVLCHQGHQAEAQPVERIPASALLDSLAGKYNVNFSYNHSLLRHLQVTMPLPSGSLAGQLRAISAQVPLRFQETGNNYFLVIPVRSSIRFDATDIQTGETLPYVYVRLNAAEKKLLLPQQQVYEIKDVFPADSLLLESTFYRPVRLRAADLEAGGGHVLFTHDTVYLDKVVVHAYICSGIDSRPGNHSVEITMKDLGTLAGETDGDVLQVLKAIPGIRSPDGKPGSLVLRGSTYDHNLVYFDDIPIYHTGHFFGTISPYNPGIVDKITVHRSALPARWGGRVGGLIDIRTSDEMPASQQFDVLTNTVYGGVQARTPIGKKTALICSARSSYPGTWQTPKLKAFSDLNFQGSRIAPQYLDNTRYLDGGLDMHFYDINGKLLWQPDENHRFALSFMHIGDDFGYRYVSNNSNRLETESSLMNNSGITARWNGKLGNKISGFASVTGSVLEIEEISSEEEASVFIRGGDKTNTIQDFRFASGLYYTTSEKWLVTAGYEVSRPLLVANELKRDGKRGNIELRERNEAFIHSFYTSYEHDIARKFTMTLGMHTDYYSLLKKLYADPRLLMTYYATPSFFLKASAARSHQYMKRRRGNDFDDFRLINQFWYLADTGNPVLRGNQVMAGAVMSKRGWLIDFEFFGKQIEGLNEKMNQDLVTGEALMTTGFDLLVKKTLNRLEWWATYSAGSTWEDSGDRQKVYYNQDHALNVALMLPLGRWNFALSWLWMAGMPVVVPGADKLKTDRPGSPDSLNISYTGNFPAQHQLDLSATYRFGRQGARCHGVAGLSAMNFYDHKNIINIFQSNVDARYPYRYGMGFSPNLQVKISF